MSGYHVAIVGATGLVGQEFIKTLTQRRFPMASIRLFASDRSVGKKIFVDHREIEVREATPQALAEGDIDIAFFSAGDAVSRDISAAAVQIGAVVIDNSAAFRLDPEVPLVVPEVNPQDIDMHKGIIANPNCSTIQMVTALYPLHRANPIKRIIVDTYQSVSGTGAVAMEELTKETKQVLEGHAVVPHVYPHQIAFNLLPEIDVFFDDGYTREEWKIIKETRKIMHAEDIAISATCVRVPVYIAHSEAVHVEFAQPISPETAKQLLTQAPGVRVLDDPAVSLYPQPWLVAGTDDVYVGRIRRDVSIPNGLAMWIVADNLRKGAALNAIQIAEHLIQRKLL